MNKNIFLFLTLIPLIIIGFLVLNSNRIEIAEAGSEHNVSGWSWTETTGWVSFNCNNPELPEPRCANNYGVKVEPPVGNISQLTGYAWSENVGWIKFNPSGPYPADPDYSARLNLSSNKLYGWARACAGAADAANCSGGTNPAAGGWDGWIKLKGAATNGSPYEVTLDTAPTPDEFMGWAWGSDVVGWNSFNCRNLNVCGTSNYKVILGLGLNKPPTVAISCDPSTCEGFSGVARGQPGALDIVYSANDPDGNLERWELKIGEIKDSGSNEITNRRWLASSLEAGNYTATIEATDDLGLTAFASVNFRIKQDAVAGFMCTLVKPELPNCQPDDSWKNCDTLRPFKGQWVYLKDDPNLSEHSIPSEGATITNRTWRLNGIQFSSIVFPQGCPSDNSYEYATAPQIGVFKIRLDIIDSNGRTDDVEHTLNGRLPPPDWIEIPPF